MVKTIADRMHPGTSKSANARLYGQGNELQGLAPALEWARVFRLWGTRRE
jgi:hypothetical protein